MGSRHLVMLKRAIVGEAIGEGRGVYSHYMCMLLYSTFSSHFSPRAFLAALLPSPSPTPCALCIMMLCRVHAPLANMLLLGS